MALHLTSQFYIHPDLSYPDPYLPGRTVKIYWDDVTEKFRVFLYDSAGTEITESLSTLLTPPAKVILNPVNAYKIEAKDFGYKYCDGLTLNEFMLDDSAPFSAGVAYYFPYCKRVQTANHWSCDIHVCDIEFDLTATAVTPDSGANDGTISVKATSTAGLVRFTRDPNATYAAASPGDVDNLYRFMNLPFGTYLIYAIDQYGCKTSITVNVPQAEDQYSTRWRLEFSDLKNVAERIDIEELEYAGSVNPVKGGAEPFQLNSGSMGQVEVFDILKGSEATINLISETDQQFIDLFTQDERKFRVKYYRDLGNLLPGFTPAVLPNINTWAGDGSGQAWIGLGIHIIGDAASEGKYTLYPFEAGRTYKFDYSLSGIINSLFSSQFRIYITNQFGADLGANKLIPFTTGVSGSHEFVAPAGADRIVLKVWQKDSDIVYYNLVFTNQTQAEAAKPVGLELQWMGFVLPMLYSEPYYLDKNYEVTILATDQIGNLKDTEFTDDYGNVLVGQMSILDAICMILRKTDVNIPIRESINIFETTMDSDPEDSSIQQAFFDSTIYNGTKCDEALLKLLVSFGGRLHQAEGYWNVELIEQRGFTYSFRVFNTNAQYVTNGSISSVSNIKRATMSDRSVLRDRSGLITIMPSYGVIRLLVKTFFFNNLLRTGNFEAADIANGQIIGWTFDLTNGSGINYGIETLEAERSGSKSALFIDFENTDEGAEVVIIPEQFSLSAINGPSLLLKLDVFLRPYVKEIYSYLDISVKIGTLYSVPQDLVITLTGIPSDDTSNLLDGEYRRFYIDEVLTWKTLELKVKSTSRYGNVELAGPVIVKIRVGNNPTADYTSITDLRTQPTTSLEQANLFRAKVIDSSLLRLYSLEAGSEAHNPPEIVRPNDHASTLKVWKLQKSFTVPDSDFTLAGLLIDNVTLALDTDYTDEFVLEKVINKNIKQPVEVNVYHTDLSITAEASIATVNANRLSKAHLRLNDGTPTSLWKRTYLDEEQPLLDILMEMYLAQVTSPSLKLSGSFFTDVHTSMANSFFEAHLQKYFILSSHNSRPLLNTFDAELLELKTGPNGEPPNPEVFEFTEEFTTEANA